jgi:uncharacterized membrane protein
MTGVAHPPLYHIVLRWWIDLFGVSPAAARSLSVLFSLLAIVAIFDITRLLSDSQTAIFAAALMALAGTQLDFAQLARSYTMVLALGLTAADLIVRIENFGPSPKRLTFLILALLALLLTHYFVAGAVAALALYSLLVLRSQSRWKTLAAFAAAGALFAILWGPFFLAQTKSYPPSDPDFLIDRAPGHAPRTIQRVLSLPLQFLFSDRAVKNAGPLTIAAELALAALTLLVPLVSKTLRRPMLLWTLWLYFTLALIAYVDLSHGWHAADFIRYSFLASPAVYAILAALDWPKKSFPIPRALPCAFVILLLAAAIHRLITGVEPFQHIDEYASALNSNAAPDELLVFYGNDPWNMPGFSYVAFRYYFPDSRRPWLILDRPADPALLHQLQSRNTLWLIGPNPDLDAPVILPGFKPWYKIPTHGANLWRMRRVAG